jgi:hypothetical protein
METSRSRIFSDLRIPFLGRGGALSSFAGVTYSCRLRSPTFGELEPVGAGSETDGPS